MVPPLVLVICLVWFSTSTAFTLRTSSFCRRPISTRLMMVVQEEVENEKKGNVLVEFLRALFGGFPLKFEGVATAKMDSSRLVDKPPKWIEPMTASQLRRTSHEVQTREEFVDTFMEKYVPYLDRAKDGSVEEKPHDKATALDQGGASAASDDA
jgi:hypothetical protein